MSLDPKGYYSALGVSSTATDTEIKKGYRLGVQKYHPDKNSSKEAVPVFYKIQEAYEVLSDPSKRQAYDLSAKPTRNYDYTSQQNTGSYSSYQNTQRNYSQQNYSSQFNQNQYGQSRSSQNYDYSDFTSRQSAQPQKPASKELGIGDIILFILYVPFWFGGPIFGILIWLLVIAKIFGK
jgi:DnaJ-class molecular chaperone